ncbi:hypothetical protein C8J56DRAFT_1058191 [Mycena floridula]|nr:hypothetical protein C8J56DRAFT_1058191 [Mycena floridula]
MDYATHEVLSLQTDPNPPSCDASLLLRLREDSNGYPKRIIQDYTDASVLRGFATFGVFWTFVNGIFSLFFGANILYFLFRRRPLSALGIVHMFQRDSMVQKWHENFLALYIEGGLPGSSSAGIVAFIRERLVDLDEDTVLGDEKDVEVQNPSSDTVYRPVATGETPGQLKLTNGFVKG